MMMHGLAKFKFMLCVTCVGYNFMKRDQKLFKQYVHRQKG